MSDDSQIDNLKKIEDYLNRRIDDANSKINLYTKIGGGLTSIILILIPLYTYVSFQDEKEKIREFQEKMKKDIEEKLDIETSPAEISIYAILNNTLSKEEISVLPVYNTCNDGYKRYSIQYQIKNIGSGRTGDVYFRFLANKEIFDSPSFDVDGFPFETVLSPSQTNLPQLPGNFTTTYQFNWCLNLNNSFKEAKIIIEVYYGNGDISRSGFLNVIE